jgi:hypothetical protein
MNPAKLSLIATRGAAAVLFLCLLVAGRPVLGQERTEDRRRFIRPETRVSDDPRRVPVSPDPAGPEGSVVLRGGRIFDGTGAAVREGTLVIERNVITGILAPGSTDWPADARVVDVTGMTVMPGLIDMHTHLTYTEAGVPLAHATDEADATLRGVERLRFTRPTRQTRRCAA